MVPRTRLLLLLVMMAVAITGVFSRKKTGDKPSQKIGDFDKKTQKCVKKILKDLGYNKNHILTWPQLQQMISKENDKWKLFDACMKKHMPIYRYCLKKDCASKYNSEEFNDKFYNCLVNDCAPESMKSVKNPVPIPPKHKPSQKDKDSEIGEKRRFCQLVVIHMVEKHHFLES